MVQVDPRTPVIVGVGQITNRSFPGPSPVELLSEAAVIAARDAGRAEILTAIDEIAVVRMSTQRLSAPGALLARLLGSNPKQTVSTKHGGQNPQALVNRAAIAIRERSADVVLIGGGEAQRTLSYYQRRGETPGWATDVTTDIPDVSVGSSLRLGNDVEVSVGLKEPVHYYALFETALAMQSESGLAGEIRRAAELWSRLSEVASSNPYAALRQTMSPDDIAEPGPQNRVISWPYTKFMTSNPNVDQAAALILCSVERARELGISSDRWVFIHGGSEGNETPFTSNRFALRSSDVIRETAEAVLSAAAIGIDDLEHVDIYSCFPSAVKIAADALGFSLDRQLTVTGGMTCFGGPWNNYVTHSIATMVELLRSSPEGYGLCTANGGVLTKHAMGIYSCRPKSFDGEISEVTPHEGKGLRPSAVPSRGEIELEAFTVSFGPDGPERLTAAGLVASGERAWGTSLDSSLISEALQGTLPRRMTVESTNLLA
jgi:acetyl-CoA C-acetyltransferase